MLQSLRVQNLAIVEQAGIAFQPGLNVITGETGAGKSVLVGALNLVLGERADKTIIRSGTEQGSVEAVFELSDPDPVNGILEAAGLPACEGGLLIIRRTLSTGSTGRATVNDSTATLQTLRSLGNLLVDMHGPHDHQSILDRDAQRDLLDAFGHTGKALASYRQAYEQLLHHRRRLAELEQDPGTVAQQIDLLQYQVKEISDAQLKPEDEHIEQEHAVVCNAQQILDLAAGIGSALTEGDGNAFDVMAFVRQRIGELADLMPEARPLAEEAAAIVVQLQELSDSVTRAVQSVETDPGRLQWLEDRMALLHRLKRKYGGTLEAIMTFHDEAAEKLADLEHREDRLAALREEAERAAQHVAECGAALNRERAKAGKAMARAVMKHLRDLGFTHGGFEVALESCEPGPAGTDTVDFLFAPNAGEPARPLRLIASSGEISRVMLAIKTVLADHDRIPVLVFDEVDANVGGEMGNAIGEKLHTVAANRQVLCITHLPQVAVYGTHHFVVRKSVQNGRTLTAIEPCREDARIDEVARMLGGRKITDVVLEHARQMLDRTPAPPA